MELDFLNDFKDSYMREPKGQGIFLAGVLLGYLAYKQAGGKNEDDITKAPLFKQIQFGRMDMKTLKRLLARVPQFIAAYREDIGKSMKALTYLSSKVGEMLLSDGAEELGIEGNFAFATGFVNANNYYWKMFSKKDD